MATEPQSAALISAKTACGVCGIETDQVEFFQTVTRPLGKKVPHCPLCFARNNDKVYISTLLAFAAELIVGVLFLVFLPSLVLGSFLLNLALLQIFIFASTVIHESGHALTGRVAGLRIFGIEIGRGHVVTEFLFGGLRWQFRSILLGGCAHGAPRNTHHYRSKQSIFILGGPLSNVILAIVAAFALPLDSLMTETFLEGCKPALMLLFANLSLLIYSLWPHEFESRYGKIPNDILLLWRTWRLPQSEIKYAPALWFFREGEESQKQGDYDTATKWIDEGLRQFPRDYWLEFLRAENFTRLKRYEDARKTYVLLLGRYGKSEAFRSLCFNAIAFVNALSGNNALLHEADVCSRLAFEKYPQNIYYKVTRGTVLIELGRPIEGLKLLFEAFIQHTEPRDRALDACCIAKGLKTLGKKREPDIYVALAKSLDSDCPLLREDPTLAPKSTARPR